jgi:hypothetical protein
MQVTIYKPEVVNLNNEQMKEVTICYLKTLVSPGEYLREEKGITVLKQDDPWHRHGSISEEYVRDATEQDILIFKLLGLLK